MHRERDYQEYQRWLEKEEYRRSRDEESCIRNEDIIGIVLTLGVAGMKI